MHGPAILEHPKVATGVLAGNPFHADATEITRIAGVDFTLNVTIDTQRRLNGELETTHLAGAAFTEKQAKVTVSKPVDAVLVSCVNRPLDATSTRTLKARSLPLMWLRKVEVSSYMQSATKEFRW